MQLGYIAKCIHTISASSQGLIVFCLPHQTRPEQRQRKSDVSDDSAAGKQLLCPLIHIHLILLLPCLLQLQGTPAQKGGVLYNMNLPELMQSSLPFNAVVVERLLQCILPQTQQSTTNSLRTPCICLQHNTDNGTLVYSKGFKSPLLHSLTVSETMNPCAGCK